MVTAIATPRPHSSALSPFHVQLPTGKVAGVMYLPVSNYKQFTNVSSLPHSIYEHRGITSLITV